MAESRKWSELTAGLTLFAVGLLFLLGFKIWHFWQFWPLSLVVLGIVQLAGARKGGSIGWGLILFLEGLLFLGVTFNLAGLDWSNFWPVLIMIVGVGLIADVLFNRSPASWNEGGGNR